MSLGTLGKYTLLERLGEGGMGEVYRAATEGHSGFRRELAIKQMRQRLTGDARLTELFLAEARSLAELRHRNIVQVFEFDVANGRPYLVMELLHGVSLGPFIFLAALPVEGVCFVGAELCDALAAVHKTGRAGGQGGMVHGDLSPSNVMACVDGAVKLLDFGLATHEQAEGSGGPQAGKLPYLAPELLAGARCDALTDVYAVGVTLYELLMGARLFPSGLDPREVSARIARADYPRLRSELPEEVRVVVERCLSRDRGDRPSASQLAKTLHGCHPRFGATELARFVRQAQGGPSALEPTGTVPRAAIRHGRADGPVTASAVPFGGAAEGPVTASALPFGGIADGPVTASALPFSGIADGPVTASALPFSGIAGGPLAASALSLSRDTQGPAAPGAARPVAELPSSAALVGARRNPRGWRTALAALVIFAAAAIAFALRPAPVAVVETPPAPPPPAVQVEAPPIAPDRVEVPPAMVPPPQPPPVVTKVPKKKKPPRASKPASKPPKQEPAPERLAPGFIAEPKN